MRINNNIMSMNTHRQLGMANAGGAKSMEKLSSGFRINRAGDDAAGLSISEKMRGQIRGLAQASRNAQDGISLIQTAEGALNETQAILQRMRELAVQSSTDTNVDTDRTALQNEMDQLATEITRISNNTEFNERKLLDGGLQGANLGELTFHIGANQGQNVQLGVAAMDAKTLGVSRDVSGVTLSAGNGLSAPELATSSTLAAGSYTVASSDVTAVEAERTLTVASVPADGSTITINGYVIGFNAGGTAVAGADSTINTTTAATTEAVRDAIVALTASIDDVTLTAGTATNEFIVTANDAGEAGNAITTVSSSVAVTGAGNLENGSDASLTYTLEDSDSNAVETLTGQALDATAVNFSTSGLSFTKDAATTTGLTATVAVAVDTATAATFAGGQTTAAVAKAGIDVSTQAAADAAITVINTAITTVSDERSKLGAVQNRLEHTIKNLDNSAENLQAAESRIRDVDMAKEMMEFTKNNILQQASTAMLAQANVAPQAVLQLLG